MLKMLTSTGRPVRISPENRRTARLLVTKGWAVESAAQFSATERGRFMVQN